jgi:hypothetical protein
MPSPSSKVHSPLGPSKSGRWLKCKASVGFLAKNAKRLPHEKPSAYAEEGKQAHDLGEKMLKGSKWSPKAYPADMVADMEGYVAFVKGQMATVEKPKLLIEQTIPLFYDRKQVGTADVVIAGSKVILVDLKYGEGVSVGAVRNPQLAIYFKSAVEHLKLKLKRTDVVVLIIYQPRAQDNRFVRKWETTWGELEEFCGEIADTALDILADPDNQPFHCEPDTVCRWCPGKVICPTYAGHLLGEAPSSEATVFALEEGAVLPLAGRTFVTADSLSDDQIARVVGAADDLRAWLKDVEALAYGRMEVGDPVPGTKLVAGRNSRDWSDEKRAYRVMKRFIPKEECRVSTLLSPHQVEQRLKNAKGLRKKPTARGMNLITALIESKPGKPKLVHMSDSRPAIDAASLLGDGPEATKTEEQSML